MSMNHFIRWMENGEKKEKIYNSQAGVLYRKKAIIRKFGEDCILEIGKTDESVPSATAERVVPKPKLLGPIDPELSRCGDEPTGKIVHSNWNNKTKTYTSRVYGTYGKNVRIVEPDGSVSLEGTGNSIVRTIEKDTYYRVMTDGRKFDAFGWPVAV